MTLKINPQKYNLTQITCKPFKSNFLSSKQDFPLARIKQSEVYEKVRFAFIRGVCGDTLSAVTVFFIFWRFKNIFSTKNATTFLELPYGISGRKTENFDFSSCATYFSLISLGLSGHCLLTAIKPPY